MPTTQSDTGSITPALSVKARPIVVFRSEGERISVLIQTTDWSALERALEGVHNVYRQGNALVGPATPRLLELLYASLEGRLEFAEDVWKWYTGIRDREKLLEEAKKQECRPFEGPPAYRRLWPFQRRAVNFLLATNRAILGDAPGLGKTAEAVSAVSLTKHNRVLVICPANLRLWWAQEIALWGWPSEQVFVVSAKTRDVDLHAYLSRPAKEQPAWLVVNWDLLRLMPELQHVSFDWLVADEAHRAKNPETQQSRALKRLHADRRVLITATPYSNRPSELWHLLHVLDPTLYRSYWFFRSFYEVVDETLRIIDVRYRALLQRDLDSFMIRRLKSEVEAQLPPKRYQTVPLYMHPEQVKLYREMVRLLMMELDSGDVITAANMAVRLVRLRQVVSGTATLEHLGQQGDVSAKLDAVVDMIQDRLPVPTVVFTVFRATALSLARRLNELKTPIPTTCIIGGTKPTTGPGSVAQGVADFQSGKTKVFVATVRSGGEGLTLTASDTIVFIDKDWNPAVQEQAENRIHRLGQDRPCLIIDMHVDHTVDDYVDEVLERKLAMSEGVIAQEVREFLEDSLKYL